MAGSVTVTDNADKQRFEAHLEAGELAGVLTYTRRDGVAVYPHTKVDRRFEGRGIGGVLVEAALDDARARGLKVDPVCPFIAAFIERTPEYKDLVAG